jgi:hypothetical protein
MATEWSDARRLPWCPVSRGAREGKGRRRAELPRGGGEDEAAAVAEGGGPRGGEAGAQGRRQRRHLAACVTHQVSSGSWIDARAAALLCRTATALRA